MWNGHRSIQIEATDELDSFFEESEEAPAQPLATDYELVETMRLIAEKRQYKAELEAEVKVLNKDLKDLNAQVLATFDARGITKMSVTGAGLFYVQSRPYPSVSNLPAFLNWLDSHNMGEIARRTVNFQTLRSWWKERMESGAELPDNTLVSVFDDRQIRVRKS